MEKLDRVDRLVLTALDDNARISISQLARELRLGRDIVEYRISKLRDLGVLRKTMVVINPHALGLVIYKYYLKLRASIKERQALFDWLKRRQSVFWVAETWGRFDAVFSALVRSPQEFYVLQGDLLSRFPELVLAHEMALTVEGSFYPRRHLISKPSSARPLLWGGQLGHSELDALDKEILSCLSEDARISHADLADRCASNPGIVRRRLEKLEQDGIIVGFRTQVDLPKMGYRYLKQQLEFAERVEDRAPRLDERLRKFCTSCTNVVFLIKQLGQHRFEIESEEPVDGEYGIVLRELDNVLGSNLRTSETLLIARDHHHRLRL